MNEIIHSMHLVSFAIGLIGCLILIYGVAIGVFQWLRVEMLFWGGPQPRGEREALRHQVER